MFVIADTARLVADGVLSSAQAEELQRRARASMVELAAGLLLTFGILAAAGGVIFWLRDAVMVAVCGSIAIAAGLALNAWAPRLLQLFGTAAILTGAGMLLGGIATELVWHHPSLAGPVMAPLGAIVLAVCLLRLRRMEGDRFAAATVMLMGLAMHLAGLGWLLADAERAAGGLPPFPLAAPLFWLYTAAALLAAGRITDLRWLTAAAILPFAQAPASGMLAAGNPGIFLFDDPTLAILQMALLAAACLTAVPRLPETAARHASLLAVVAVISANAAAFAGSLQGDTIGSVWFGTQPGSLPDIGKDQYSLLWAAALAAMILWSAVTLRRGIFNVSLCFAALHAYLQIFLRFDGQPLAFVIAGVTAIPLAWAARMANRWLAGRSRGGTG